MFCKNPNSTDSLDNNLSLNTNINNKINFNSILDTLKKFIQLSNHCNFYILIQNETFHFRFNLF